MGEYFLFICDKAASMRLQLITLLCMVVINMEQVYNMKMGGNTLENFAANEAEKQVAMIAKDRSEESVESKMGCGCKCGCQVPSTFILAQVETQNKEGELDLPMDCGCECDCQQ